MLVESKEHSFKMPTLCNLGRLPDSFAVCEAAGSGIYMTKRKFLSRFSNVSAKSFKVTGPGDLYKSLVRIVVLSHLERMIDSFFR